MDGYPRRTIITANRLVKRFITRRWSGGTRKRSVARSPVLVEMGSGTFWSVATARLAIREAPHIRIALFLPWQVELSLCAKTTDGAAGSNGIVTVLKMVHNYRHWIWYSTNRGNDFAYSFNGGFLYLLYRL